MVKDLYNSRERFERWKEEAKETGFVEGINKKNSEIIINYLTDMELGKNTGRGSKKGSRSYLRLNTLRIRITFITKLLENKGIKDLNKTSEKQIHEVFDDMKKGRIKRKDGGTYKSVADYIKVFKAFWHWLQKTNRKEGKDLKDITQDLDSSYDENGFVYFTKEELNELMPYFTKEEQLRMLFMFDTIIRSPTELMNIKVSDFSNGFKELSIREETSKTYGRTIKILLCSDGIKECVKEKKLGYEDFLFKFSPPLFNKKLKKVAKQVFGDKMTKGGNSFSSLTMYDFRHSGACYWRLGAYKKKIDALMYRGGWSNLTTLNYYTKKIGMKDSIEKDDLLIETDKNELEKKIEALEKSKKETEKGMEELGKIMREILKTKTKLKVKDVEVRSGKKPYVAVKYD